LGYPRPLLWLHAGYRWSGWYVDQNAVDTINKGDVPIVEPDLDIVVRAVVTTGNIRATTIAEPADAFLLAVPTPFKKIIQIYVIFKPQSKPLHQCWIREI